MQKRTSSQAGFSMVELLVAVVILAVGLLGLAELQITAMKTNAQSESIAAAGSIAQRVIEEIAAMNDADAIFDADVLAYQPWTGPSGGQISLPGAGTYFIDFKLDKDYQGVTNLCQITIRVESQNKIATVIGHRLQTVEVTTMKRAS